MSDYQYLATLISALLIFLGVVYKQSRDKKQKHAAFLRMKYEKMGTHFLDSLDELERSYVSTSFDHMLQNVPMNNATKASLVALLYFPDMLEPLNDYTKAIEEYHKSVIQIYSEAPEHWKQKTSYVLEICQKRNPAKLKEAEEKIRAMKAVIVEDLKKNASRYAPRSSPTLRDRIRRFFPWISADML